MGDEPDERLSWEDMWVGKCDTVDKQVMLFFYGWPGVGLKGTQTPDPHRLFLSKGRDHCREDGIEDFRTWTFTLVSWDIQDILNNPLKNSLRKYPFDPSTAFVGAFRTTCPVIDLIIVWVSARHGLVGLGDVG